MVRPEVIDEAFPEVKSSARKLALVYFKKILDKNHKI